MELLRQIGFPSQSEECVLSPGNIRGCRWLRGILPYVGDSLSHNPSKHRERGLDPGLEQPTRGIHAESARFRSAGRIPGSPAKDA